MRKIIEYDMVVKTYEYGDDCAGVLIAKRFITEVNERIKQGWQPMGGAFEFDHTDDGQSFGQALVKYED